MSPGRWETRREAARVVLVLSGDWSIADTAFTAETAKLLTGAEAVAFDTAGLGAWDSALLVFLAALRQAAARQAIAFDAASLPEPVRRLLALLPPRAAEAMAPARRAGLAEAAGLWALGAGAGAVAMAEMAGGAALLTVPLLRRRAHMRGADLLVCLWDAGIAALPIVLVINGLVGAILAFVGAVQLRRFGANLYVADLVSVGVVREMGPLMTGIVMAGRSGGAYAAQLASMQGSEEVDALRVLGVPVFAFLLMPRIVALTAMLPVLYCYGSLIGVLGGLAVAVPMLGVRAGSFFTEVQTALTPGQIVFGLVKTIGFGALIAFIGCHTGMRAGRSAADVGHAATQAVVSGIAGVIALDAVFALCANSLGI